MSETVSACITVYNEAKNIRRCLDSIKWVDEIVVIDSYSDDDTVEICREYTDRVYQHEWLGYIGQKNLARDYARSKWIIFIDADEEVSPELKAEIQEELNSGRCSDTAGFEFPRMVWYLGRWIRHGEWYPDYKLRLFQKEMGHCGGIEPHDQVIVTSGRVDRLRSPLYHYTYDDINHHIETMNRFSLISAQESHHAGRRVQFWDMIFRPPFRFFRCYVMKAGMLDGMLGLIIAITISYGTFIKYAKLWELQLAEKRRRPDD